jgi:hypothetical protein
MVCLTDFVPRISARDLSHHSLWLILAMAGSFACGSNSDQPVTFESGGASGNGSSVGGAGLGGNSATGSTKSTIAAGGSSTATGGQVAAGGVAESSVRASTTGSSAKGGAAQSGGAAAGGKNGTGGKTTSISSSGGSPAGGANANGGQVVAAGGKTIGGGTPASGGSNESAGGKPATGGTPASGGASGSSNAATGGGDSGTVCALPTKFKWTSSGPLAKVPRTIDGHNVIAIKDFTDVVFNNKHIVYATAYEGGWKSAMFVFDDWANWDATAGSWFSKNAVAPTLVYFTPKKTWVLTYQWGFQYATSDDPTDVSKWSGGKNLLSGGPSGAIDQTLICDATNCYLFFAGDNGNIYRSDMPIGNFPGTFSGYKTILTDTQAKLFEAVEVYTVKGANQYLMIVEAMGSGGRYFRAFTSTSLGGTFTALSGADTESSPLAGKSNVTYNGGANWSNDISHGDMVRTDPSETQTIDPCNLQFLYQGYDKSKNSGDYGTTPYQPGLLTLQR